MGVAVALGAQVWKAQWASLIGLLILIVSVFLWMRPPSNKKGDEEEIEQFAREHGIPVNNGSAPVLSRGAVFLTALIIGVLFASMIFAYFYLRIQVTAWPPDVSQLPGLVLPIVALIFLIAGGGATYWGVQGIRNGNGGSLRAALGIAFVLGAIADVLLVYDTFTWNFLWTFNAYTSLTYLFVYTLIAVITAGLVLNIFVQIWAWRGHYSPVNYQGIEVHAIYWYTMVASGVLVFLVAYLSPYLI